MIKSISGRLKTITIVILSIIFSNFADGWCLNVSGTLDGGDWTLADSPVLVTDDIILQSGSTLRIEAGVQVQFEGPYKFFIHGLLEAMGASEAEIVFFSVDSSVDSLRWGGLRFVNAERGCKLVYCKVQDGWARGSWPDNNGGGIYIESSSVDIQRCEISHNRADGDGGGLYCWYTQSRISNSLIVENYSNSMGGGMFITYSSPQINNCTVAFDSCRIWGGGMFIGAEGSPSISNCIIVSNFNDVDGDIAPGDDFFPDLARAKSSSPTVSFSCIRVVGEDAYGGAGNIVGDPLFVNQPVGIEENPFVPPADYHLNYSSPCIDGGDPSMSAGLESDNRVNMGAYGGTESSALSVPVFSISSSLLTNGIDFVERRIGSQTAQEITINNLGHSHLQIDSIMFGNSAFFPDSAKQDDGLLVPSYRASSIAPGERIKFSIQFTPIELIEYVSSAIIYTNDTIATTTIPEIPLNGVGIDPIAEFVELIQFEPTQLGSDSEVRAYIKNIGRSTLNIGSISIQGDYFNLEISRETVAPGDSARAVATFEPQIPGGAEAFASINTNDVDLSVILRGIGIGPKMEIDVDTLFLGFVYFDGDTVRHELEISNEGDDVLIITEAGVSSEAFSTILPEGGISIAPEQTGLLPILFHPQEPELRYEGVLTVSSNYPADHTINLAGQGMPEPGRYVFGEVSGYWGSDPNNPEDIIVLDSVLVPTHETLSIGPGVRILFESGGKFKADGIVRAVGAMSDSIYFLPRNSSGSDSSRWGGIEFAHKDASRMAYCVVRNTVSGLSIRESSPLIEFCTFENNGIESILFIDEEDETNVIIGGGISLENSGARISGCIIENNIGTSGGGILVLNSKPVITNCIIRHNRAITGGAMSLIFQASAIIRSNIIHDNSAEIICGGISVVNQSAPQIINNTIIRNIGCGVYSASTSLPVIINSIIWDNIAINENFNDAVEITEDANALISFSDMDGEVSGTENLNIDPLFLDRANDDYQLAINSPLIDRGNTEPEHRDYSFPPSLGDEINDIGAFGGPLGGSWDAAEFSVSVFQNPAFPHWLDITLTSIDELSIIPICSLGIVGLNREQLDLTALDDHSFYGTYQSVENGTLFLTVDIEKSDGTKFKTGRTFELFFLGGDNAVTNVPFGGITGQLEVKAGSIQHDSYIISGSIQSPVQPTKDRLYLTTPFYISGIKGEINPPALLKLRFDPADWTEGELSKLNLYRLIGGKYEKLNGGYKNGYVSAKVKHGGTFVLGWGEDSNLLREDLTPQSIELLSAYPNPFNQSTILEMELRIAGFVSLSIYNLRGQKITTLYDQYLEVGRHQMVWSGNDNHGLSLPSGLYWARATTPGQSKTVKLLLLR